MFAYFLPEILILFAIMSHIQKEIMIGILYHKEGELETIEQALIRYVHLYHYYHWLQMTYNKQQNQPTPTII